MALVLSIGFLTGVIVIADLILAFRGDWTRIVRITLGAATYVGVLGVILKSTGLLGAPPARLPVWMFWAAGAAGGLMSSLARPEFSLTVLVGSTILAPLLLATFHWFSLRTWSRISGRATSTTSAGRAGE